MGARPREGRATGEGQEDYPAAEDEAESQAPISGTLGWGRAPTNLALGWDGSGPRDVP